MLRFKSNIDASNKLSLEILREFAKFGFLQPKNYSGVTLEELRQALLDLQPQNLEHFNNAEFDMAFLELSEELIKVIVSIDTKKTSEAPALSQTNSFKFSLKAFDYQGHNKISFKPSDRNFGYLLG